MDISIDGEKNPAPKRIREISSSEGWFVWKG